MQLSGTFLCQFGFSIRCQNVPDKLVMVTPEMNIALGSATCQLEIRHVLDQRPHVSNPTLSHKSPNCQEVRRVGVGLTPLSGRPKNHSRPR